MQTVKLRFEELPKEIQAQVRDILSELARELESEFCSPKPEEHEEVFEHYGYSDCMVDRNILGAFEDIFNGGYTVIAELLLNGGEDARLAVVVVGRGTRILVIDEDGYNIRVISRRVGGARVLKIITHDGRELELAVDGELDLSISRVVGIGRASGYIDLNLRKALLGVEDRVLVDFR